MLQPTFSVALMYILGEFARCDSYRDSSLVILLFVTTC